MDDRSDILGGQLHVARPDPIFVLSGPSFSGTMFYGILLIAVFAGLYSLTPHYRQYQEQRYRRAMRRRHGIPDSDHRPFNVAYAAVKRAQREREMEEKGRSKRGIRLPPGASRTALGRQGSIVPGQATRQWQAAGIPGQLPQVFVVEDEGADSRSSFAQSRRASGQTTTASESDFQLPGAPREDGNEKLAPSGSKQTLYAPAFTRGVPAVAANGKHARDEEDIEVEDEQGVKKSRTERHDINEDAQWEGDIDDDMEVDEATPVPRKRGTKRLASLEEDEGFESSKAIGRDKRARKILLQEAKAMRGKKRDRAEAGSTFGGEDSSAEEEDGDKHRSNRRRRLAHKKSLVNLRGRKRVREPEIDSDDDDSDSPSKRAARHKRGKRSPGGDEFLSDDGMVSNDPLCKGRRIGEEWETNGVKFKVGPNGQRLRQALVKKSRSRFPMPKDSEHPDRRANIDVYVEVWLSEEEYQAAKEHNELAWQSPSTSVIELPEEPESPTKGKSLLWSSTAQKEAVRKAVPLAKSASANASLRVTASALSNGLQRRISTIVAQAPPPAPESPKVKSSKSYSKWEKQDLEAAAMTRLRQKAKADEAALQKKGAATTTATSTFSPAAPAAKSTENTAKPAEAPKLATTFSLPATSTTAPTAKASTSDLPSLSIPSSAPKPAEPTKTSTLTFPTSSSNATSGSAKPVAPAAPAASTTFTFGKPVASQPTTTASTTAKPTNNPGFFAKPTAPASASTPNPFGGNTQQSGATSLVQPSSTPGLFSNNAQTRPVSSVPNPFGGAPSQTGAQQPSKPAFGFGTAATDASKKSEDKPAQPAQSAASSLLARMGGFAGNDAPSSTGAATAPAAPATQSPPTFSFSKPATPAPTTVPAASSTSNGAAPVKFNFGVASKPANAFAPSAPAAASDAPKPASAFGSNSTATFSSSNTEVPKFGFGAQPATSHTSTSGTSNTFGNTSASGSSSSLFGAVSAPKDATATPAKSAFGRPAFPSTPANQTAKQPLFGVSTTPAGTPSVSMFAEPQTPANNNTASPMSTTPAGTPMPSSVFGNNAATTTPAGPPPKPAFGFGGTVSTTPAGPPPKSMFSFGNPAAPAPGSLFGSTSKLGATAAPGSTETKSAEPSKSAFVFPSAPASNGPATAVPGLNAGSMTAPTFSFGTNPAAQPSNTAVNAFAKPSFAFGNTSTPSAGAFSSTPAFGSNAAGSGNATENKQAATQPNMGTFGFGAPSGTSSFAFGQSKPPEAGQK